MNKKQVNSESRAMSSLNDFAESCTRSTKVKQNFNQVTEFNLETIMCAFREGRLFIQPKEKSEAELREEGISQILQYVSRIDTCASDAYLSNIRSLWEHILSDPQLQPLFFFDRYSTSRGQVNWYRVTVVVCLLSEWGIYSRQYSGTQLHCMLEASPKRNGRYTGMARYLLDGRYFSIIRRILKEIGQ